jgi:hypothetical protein
VRNTLLYAPTISRLRPPALPFWSQRARQLDRCQNPPVRGSMRGNSADPTYDHAQGGSTGRLGVTEAGKGVVIIGPERLSLQLLLPGKRVRNDGGEIIILWFPPERRAGAIGSRDDLSRIARSAPVRSRP